jgi:hypothetical protein
MKPGATILPETSISRAPNAFATSPTAAMRVGDRDVGAKARRPGAVDHRAKPSLSCLTPACDQEASVAAIVTEAAGMSPSRHRNLDKPHKTQL